MTSVQRPLVWLHVADDNQKKKKKLGGNDDTRARQRKDCGFDVHDRSIYENNNSTGKKDISFEIHDDMNLRNYLIRKYMAIPTVSGEIEDTPDRYQWLKVLCNDSSANLE